MTYLLGWYLGHPFLDGNKRTGESSSFEPCQHVGSIKYADLHTAFFVANEYLRALGLPGLLDECEDYESLTRVADRYVDAAAGQLDVEGLVKQSQLE